MTRRHLLAATALAFAALGAACVDLFHSTDFETLCMRAPDDARCAAADASAERAPDAVAVKPPPTDARPPPDFCSWSTDRARAEAHRACAWLGACEGPLEESAFGRCVVHAQLAFDCAANPALRPAGATEKLWDCLTTVATCKEVDDCVFPGGYQGCSAFESGSFNQCASVEANAANRVECLPGAGQHRAAGVEPCVMLGKTCDNENGGSARCGGVLGYQGACTKSECRGTSAVDCDLAPVQPFDRGLDCASFGGSCAVNKAGAPVCHPGPSATACSEEAVPTCEGDVVTACVGGKQIRVNCTNLHLPCEIEAAMPAHDPTAGCGHRTGGNVCSERNDDKCVAANVLESCGRGVLQRVDCAAVGLGPCALTNGRAACTPPSP